MTVKVDQVTAGGITRTLRGKDISIDEIYKISNDLLDGAYDLRLYLPDKEKFVFELVIDRLSQQKFKSFKLSSQIWELFSKCWDALGKTDELITIRNKLSSRMRFNEIAVQTLNEIETTNSLKTDTVLLGWINKGLSLILKESKLVVSDEQSITIISKLLQLIKSNELSCDPILIQEVISTANKVYRLSNTSVARYGPKNVQSFCSVCLPAILYFSSSSEATSENHELLNSLRTISSDILFRKENLSHLESNVKSFVNSSVSQELDSSSVAYCFELLIAKVDVEKLEGLFTIFTSSYPDIKGKLLTKIVAMNRTLSTDFLSSLVEKELGNSSMGYTIIIQSLERNSAVGIKYANEIFDLSLNKSSYGIDELELLTSLLNCYVRSREIPEFEKLWRSYISKSSSDDNILVSESLINIVSQKLITLSNVQITRLVETLVGEFSSDIRGSSYVLIAIATGLLTSITGSTNSAITKGLITITESLKPVLLKLFDLDTKEVGGNEHYWNLIYLILCLYDLDDLREISFDTFFGKPKGATLEIPSFYFSVFRILEQDLEALPEKFKAKVLSKFISVSLKKHGAEKMLVARWFVLLEYSLDGELPKFVELLFEKNNLEFLRNFLTNDVLHEQNKLIESIIDCFIKKIQDSKTREDALPFLVEIPIYCFKRSQREALSNFLVDKFIDSKSEALQRMISKAIKHVLQQPTFKSLVETDIQKSLKLISSSKTEELSEASLDIVQEIMLSHLRQGSDKVSSKILSKFTESLVNGLSSFSETKGMNDLSVLKCTMCLFKAERQLAKDTYTYTEEYVILAKTCLRALNGSKLFKSSDICLLLDVLSEMNLALDLPEEPLKKIVPKLGFQYSDHVAVSESLFSLLASIKTTECRYIMALFIVLHSKVDQTRLLKDFSAYLGNVEDETLFLDNWNYLLHCLNENEVDSGSLAAHSDLLTAFLISVKKSEESLPLVHKYVVMTISTIMNMKDDNLSGYLKSVSRFANAIGALLVSKSWTLVQYTIELIVAYSAKISYSLLITSTSTDIEEVYYELNRILSNILLVHRFRFSNRQHLLIASVLPMMELMFQRNKLGLSKESTLSILSFEKLLGYLCEPSSKSSFIPNNNKQDSNSVALTTSLSIAKAHLRKSLPNLLLNYIYFYLKYSINPAVRDSFNRCIFLVFDVLTTNELSLVNQSIDSQSRVIFRNIYDDYKKFGKWREE